LSLFNVSEIEGCLLDWLGASFVDEKVEDELRRSLLFNLGRTNKLVLPQWDKERGESDGAPRHHPWLFILLRHSEIYFN